MRKATKEKMGVLCKKILLELFNATVVVGTFMEDRRDPMVYKEFIAYERWKRQKRYLLHQKIYNLQQQGLIEKLYDTKGIKLIRLTPAGIIRALKYKFDSKADKIPPWDKKWRIVVFDVEEKRKNDREILRNILIKWGFEPLQKSVYVFPHHCLPEINLAKEAMNLQYEIKYIEANRIDGDFELRKVFHEKKLI